MARENLSWSTTSDWDNAQSDTDAFHPNDSILLFTALTYEYYDTQSYYDTNDHPTTTSEMDNFFDDSNSGVTFGGSGNFVDRIYWGDKSQTGPEGTVDAKPSYLPADGYSWKVEGYVKATESGTYSIATDGDDANDVFVDNTLTANFYGGHGFEGSWTADADQNQGSVDLTAGVWYPFKARMEEGGGGDGIAVGWQPPSASGYDIIPEGSFYSSTGSLTTAEKLT